MSWERQPLYNKAKLFFEKAFDEEKDTIFFGLWCAMGLELLSRSALAFVSPTLLADPDRTHTSLLHALGHGSAKGIKKSIQTSLVLQLCQTLIKDFNDEDLKLANAIINRRNEELHTGAAAFEDYTTQQWITGFYKICKILTEFQEESLSTLFPKAVDKEAHVVLTEVKDEVHSKTQSTIAAHKKVFENKTVDTQNILKEKCKKETEVLAYKGHHRVQCPSCGCSATVTGEQFGPEKINNGDREIIVKVSILPTKFFCNACELKLEGYYALKSGNLADHYTRTTRYSPESYYDMIDGDDYDAIRDRYNLLFDSDPFSRYMEYDNE